MSDFIKEATPVLMLLLGWLMGLLSPGIAERIRRTYVRRDLMAAVVDELLGLQYTMANAACILRERDGQITDEFLDRMIPVIESYRGFDRRDQFVEALKGFRTCPMELRAAASAALRKPNEGLTLRQYNLPLFVAQMSNLALCPLPFQRAVLHIRSHLDLYNQAVPVVQSAFEKTFANPSPSDRAKLIQNIETGYRDQVKRAEMIVDAIEGLKKMRA